MRNEERFIKSRLMVKPKLLYHLFFVFCLALAGVSISSGENSRTGPSVDFGHGGLKVSENKRFLVHEDGTPFFYLGDTAWELFHRLGREEAGKYLESRRTQGFTVIQAVVLAELDGLNTPNANGDRPLSDDDPAKPNEAYFKHVDWIVNKAEEKGIYIGMLPTWGDKVTKAWGKGPVIFTNDNLDDARAYGSFLGARYKDKPNIIWILGGDRIADNAEQIWRAMAGGIKQADQGRHLMTYHPQGGNSSAKWFGNDDWLDFNMLQSGHDRFDNPNYEPVSKDYNRKPVKPCLDGEPRYEDHPVNWDPKNGWFGDFDVRQAAYWSLFAGAFGHTYGCHDIWQMYAPGRQPISSARNNWYDVLELPGAWDMMHIRNLIESRPFLTRVPDQSLIERDAGSGPEHIRATRGEDYAFIYLPYGQKVGVALGKISGEKVRAWWFDPRTGRADSVGTFNNQGTQQFDPPGEAKRGNDWVLVLDDAGKDYSSPGKGGNDWPQFRGPNRDGKSNETGLLKKWPEAGPKQLWSVEGLGIGYSSVAVAGGFVYTTGMIDGEGFMFAYDLEGNLKWKKSYGPEWTRSYKGTRTTPTIDSDRVYVFSGTGVMACFEAGTGAKIWEVNTLEKFEGRNIQWGMSGSPLIDGDKIYCTPGGKKGVIVALDKMTGRTIWTTTGLDEVSAYSSAILIERGGNRLLINIIQKSVICVNADNGKLIWREPYVTPSDTGGVTPIYKDGCVYVTSAVEREFTRGGVMFELSADGTSVTEKWNDQTLDCGHGGVVLVDGYLYGSTFDGIPKGDWVCLDWDSGKVMYKAKWNGNKGSIIYADGMLYCYDENTGDVALVKASPDAFDIVSTFRVTGGDGQHWAHPAISDGRLYIRHGDALMAYDIKNGSSG